MLDWIEELLTPEELPGTPSRCCAGSASDNYPSIPMIARLKRLS